MQTYSDWIGFTLEPTKMDKQDVSIITWAARLPCATVSGFTLRASCEIWSCPSGFPLSKPKEFAVTLRWSRHFEVKRHPKTFCAPATEKRSWHCGGERPLKVSSTYMNIYISIWHKSPSRGRRRQAAGMARSAALHTDEGWSSVSMASQQTKKKILLHPRHSVSLCVGFCIHWRVL